MAVAAQDAVRGTPDQGTGRRATGRLELWTLWWTSFCMGIDVIFDVMKLLARV